MHAMGEHIRFLELRRAECDHRPELHRHQIAAYDTLLAAARAPAAQDDYLRSPSNVLAVARAEWMDRYHFFGRIAAALGDEQKQRAAQLNFDAAQSATTYAEFTSKVLEAKRVAARLRRASDVATGTMSSLVTWLIEWVTEGYEGAKNDKRNIVRTYWNTLVRNDPGCSWQRICEHRPYRDRLPFGDAQLATIGTWLDEVLEGAPPAEDEPDPTFETADATHSDPIVDQSVEEVARGFHIAYDALSPTNPTVAEARATYERVFEIEATADSTQAFYRALAEQGLFCQLARAPWIGIVRAHRDHCTGLSQLHLEAHYAELSTALDACVSPTDVEYECERASELLVVESAWNDLFLTTALKPFIAALAYEFDRTDERRNTVRASNRVVEDLFGLPAASLLDTPRIREFVADVLFTRGQRVMPEVASPGIVLGEIGLLAVQEVREAAMNHVMAEIRDSGTIDPAEIQDLMKELSATPRFASVDDMRAHVLALLAQAVDYAAGAPSNGVPVVLWGQPTPLLGLIATLRKPPRPTIELG